MLYYPRWCSEHSIGRWSWISSGKWCICDFIFRISERPLFGYSSSLLSMICYFCQLVVWNDFSKWFFIWKCLDKEIIIGFSSNGMELFLSRSIPDDFSRLLEKAVILLISSWLKASRFQQVRRIFFFLILFLPYGLVHLYKMLLLLFPPK